MKVYGGVPFFLIAMASLLVFDCMCVYVFLNLMLVMLQVLTTFTIHGFSVHSARNEKQWKYREVSLSLYGAVCFTLLAKYQDRQVWKTIKCQTQCESPEFDRSFVV